MNSAFKFRSEQSYMGQLIGWIGTIALVTALSMFYIWNQLETRDVMREILLLEHQKEGLKKESAYLHVRIVRLAEKHRLETVAMNRFDLDHTAVGQVVAMDVVDTAMALARSADTEPDVRAIAGDPSEASLILASFPVARVDTR